MASHHEPFKALGPIDWADVPRDDGLDEFLGRTFADAQTVIASIPSPTARDRDGDTSTGRARAKTDSAVAAPGAHESPVSQGLPAASVAAAEQLRKEWKEVKANPRDNPLGISVYKLASRDGKGSWFARRSVHEGLSFARWQSGLEREFAETMKVQGSPGSGSIRGIGAERRVEHRVVEGAGRLNVFQLSAQFPGPTSPRDFITLLLTSDLSGRQADQPTPLRQYMVVSKPCAHPECPPRQGIIRGQYESVEIIREVPSEAMANKRSFSYADLATEESRRASTTKAPGGPSALTDEASRAVEWLMVTRSDPGGSVPRFMIEKGTPPGIVGDAAKFLDWATSISSDDSRPVPERASPSGDEVAEAPTNKISTASAVKAPVSGRDQGRQAPVDEGIPSSNGLYGIIAGAIGAATSVAYGLRQQFSSPLGFSSSQDSLPESQDEPDEPGDDKGSESDASSTRSFASALEKSVIADKGIDSTVGSNSDESRPQINQSNEREMQRLMERRRKLDEDYARMQQRLESRRLGDKEKDAAALAKVREKREKELAKQEAKYKREMKKLEEKREQQERKAESRLRKTIEKEEKLTLSLELERVKTERDVALKKLALLQGQVGELQAQNTMLVAKLGRLGAMSRENSLSSKEAALRSPRTA